MSGHILALDQGTTSSRAMIFGPDASPVAMAQQEFPQHYPAPGLVEHTPDDLLRTTLATARQVIAKAAISASGLAAIGIANQRETTLIWDRRTGRPLHPAIVWQDRRTADDCRRLRQDGVEPTVTERTGLLLDPYFSATKLAWLLDNVDGARASADAGHIAFGTVDSYLLWHLTSGKSHLTDATNAARTALFDIHKGQWSDDLLRLFRVPRSVLPEVRDSAGDFGVSDPALFGAAIPIRGIAGDQQAATAGQGCFQPGMMKATYGTGCFALMHTGETAVASKNRLLTTIACQLAGKRTYALEGAIFMAGATVQWLRDGPKLLEKAAEAGEMAMTADPDQRVYVVPAFVGLGAPHWEPDAQGAIFGLTRATGRAELARAALESVAYQTRDLVQAMHRDWPDAARPVLRVDGGMVASDWTMQFLADMLDAPVDRPVIHETTALGAAWLAGYASGVWPDQAGFQALLRRDRQFSPSMSNEDRERRYSGWRKAVAAVIGYARAGDAGNG